MASSILSNPFLTNSTYWWMNAGLPFVLPTIGSNGRWDGSKWVQDTNTSTTPGVTDSSTIYPGYSSGNSSMSSPGISSSTMGNSGAYSGAVNGFGLSTPGFAGSFNDSAVASMGQQGALSGMVNSAMASVGNAALTGSIAGGITGSLSNGISTAVAGLANPSSIAGVIGGALNGALGFSTSPAIGALAGLASLASPALGLAVGVFGPAIADLAMDAFDARENENTKDFAEALSNSYAGGRISGAHLSNALNNRGMQLSYQSLANPMTEALSQLGVTNKGVTQEALTAAYQDLGFTPDVAAVSALADVVGQNISDITSDYGVGFGSQQAGAGLGMGNPTGDFGWGGVVDAALSDTVSGLGLSTEFGQVDTTTQGPSAASTSIGQGVSDQASTASLGNEASTSGPAGTSASTGDTSSTSEGQSDSDSSSDSSSDSGGDGGDTGDSSSSGDSTGDSSGTGTGEGDGAAGSDSGEGSDGNDD